MWRHHRLARQILFGEIIGDRARHLGVMRHARDGAEFLLDIAREQVDLFRVRQAASRRDQMARVTLHAFA